MNPSLVWKWMCVVLSLLWLAGTASAANETAATASPSGVATASATSGASWVSNLPAVNAGFNTLSTVFLTLGFVFIRKKKQQAHRNCMLAALTSSALFLAGYLTYHFTVPGVTRFLEPAWFRPIYLAILLTHTVLAVVIVPLVLITLSQALRQRFDRHRKIARWTWPLWMYVSVTGVVIYLLLYQIFPQH